METAVDMPLSVAATNGLLTSAAVICTLYGLYDGVGSGSGISQAVIVTLPVSAIPVSTVFPDSSFS